MTMNADAVLDGLKAIHPVVPQACTLNEGCGLVIVDVVRGFCAPGGGALAPAAPGGAIARMVHEVATLARRFAAAGLPIYVACDQTRPRGRNRPTRRTASGAAARRS